MHYLDPELMKTSKPTYQLYVWAEKRRHKEKPVRHEDFAVPTNPPPSLPAIISPSGR